MVVEKFCIGRVQLVPKGKRLIVVSSGSHDNVALSKLGQDPKMGHSKEPDQEIIIIYRVTEHLMDRCLVHIKV